MSADELHADTTGPGRAGADLQRARLRLSGRSRDGSALVLVNDAGVEFTVDIDARLREALAGSPGRTARETTMESTLRPRDIQTRIRAGETPESVAEAAHTTVEKIMPFAGPVLAEREHVAQRAQRSSVRRRAGESAPTAGARTLEDAIAGRLRALNIDPETVTWDAWRREDGKWTLTAAYTTGARSGSAELTFDAPGNFVVLDNDDARWLVGDEVPEDVVRPADSDDLQRARARRLSAVGEEELPLGVDAIELVSDDAPAVETEPTPVAEPAPEQVAPQPVAEDPAGREPAETPAAEEPPARRAVRKNKGRASVPSWDEIMFGGGDQE